MRVLLAVGISAIGLAGCAAGSYDGSDGYGGGDYGHRPPPPAAYPYPYPVPYPAPYYEPPPRRAEPRLSDQQKRALTNCLLLPTVEQRIHCREIVMSTAR